MQYTGMTGGQMAPTSLKGQITTTSSLGRDPLTQGYPIKVSEMLAQLNGPSYIERVSLTTPLNVKKAKASIKKAFTYQLEGRGFSMIEVLSSCPVNWGMSPQESLMWIDKEMTKVFPTWRL